MMECQIANNVVLLTKPEKRSHSKCLMIFFIFMILYVGVAIYAPFHNDVIKKKAYENEIGDEDFSKNVGSSENKDDNCKVTSQFIRKVIHNIFKALSDFFDNPMWMIIFFAAISFLTSALCIPLIRKMPIILIKIMMVLDCFICAGIFYLLFIIFFLNINRCAIPFILIIIYYVWDFYGKIYATYYLGIKVSSEIAKESCRAISASPLLFLLAFFNTTFMLWLTSLTYNIFIMLKITNISDPAQWYIIIFHCINIVSYLWLTSFIVNFTEIICARTFSTWFYSTEKSSFTNSTTAESIVITLRYHLGTAAYASSLWALFISMYIMIKNFKNKARETRYNMFFLIPFYWNTYLKLFEGGCIMTAIQGTNFKKSADSACRSYLNYPLQLYAIKGYRWNFNIVEYLLTIILGSIFSGNQSSKLSLEESMYFTSFVMTLILPAYLIVKAAVETITLCAFKELECEKQNQIRSNFMNSKLKISLLSEKL